MNTSTYYQGASAFLAFDVFMVIVFTVVQVGLARALPHAFLRTLAAIWLVHVVRVAERSLYFVLPDRTGLDASLLIGVFAATCALQIPLVQHAVRLDRTAVSPVPRHLWRWALGAFLVGTAIHGVTARLDPQTFELSAAIWSRAFAVLPLLPLLAITRPSVAPMSAVRPLYWGFVAQLIAVFIDAAMRIKSFAVGFNSIDSLMVASMTLASTLSIGIASLLAAVEYEREAMSIRAARLKQAQERAVESERWQQVGQLARGVAHDFNNILGVIVSGSDLAEDGIRDGDPTVETDLTEMDHAVTRGRALTQRLLRFSRHQPIEPRAIDIGQVSGELLPMLRLLATSERALTLHVTATQTVNIDPTAVEQILLNLVVNARDATKRDGRVDVHVSDCALSSRRPAAVGALQPGNYVCIAVEDDGCGMSPAVLARLWEPFFTTKGERGSGIGLPTVAMVTVEAGGAIVVESTEGTGTQFQVWLPAA
ncbi:MAG: hypothetical protein IBJ03_05770 [Gemmatimonadaceae bacterium]|nr:hypothetical protein [Gemmatimonadaceae bacterium]